MIPRMILHLTFQHNAANNSIMKYPTLRFVFDPKHVATKQKKGLVQLEILSQGKRKWIGTGVKLYSDQWNDRKKVINSADMFQLNQWLDEIMRIIQDWINDLIRRKEAFEFEKLNAFLKYFNHSENYIEFLERCINERNDITESTKKSHRALISSLKEFGGIKYMSDLTSQNIKLYDNWLHGKGYSQPTIHNYHKRNKVYIHEAMALGLIREYPYTGVTIKRGKHKIRRFLYEEELNQVRNAIIPNESISRVRDLFVFQSFTGLAYADLAKFNFKKDVVQHEGKYIIRDVRTKTEENYYIILLSPALEILRRYDYELPVISNAQYNLRLKLVADYAGLNKNLTTHLARHFQSSFSLKMNGLQRFIS